MKKFQRVCVENNCNREFETNYERRIYCSGKCQRREWNRSDNAKTYRSSSKHRMYKQQYDAKYCKENPEKIKAHTLAQQIPLEPCEICNTEEGIHRHHDDYSRPLEIRFLCDLHHGETRRING